MKNDSLIYSDILKTIKTTTHLENFVSQIDSLLAGLYKIAPGSFEEGLNKTGSTLATLLLESFQKNNIDKKDQSSIEKFLTGLKERAQQLKIMKLQIALDPSEEIINDIHTWIYKNIGQNIILDITCDESLIGGAIITFEGKYKDLSLKKRFSDIFKNNTSILKKLK